MTLVSVQAFGLADPGGGPRILRALYDRPPVAVLSIATRPRVPPRAPGHEERHIALRPALGPLEGSRVAGWAQPLELALATLLRARLERVLRARRACAVHAVAHGGEFWPAYGAARSSDLPFFLTVHDDVGYNLRGSLALRPELVRLGVAWRAAAHRFVISRALGEEYSMRYGERPYSTVTDGLDERSLHAPRAPKHLHVYFAGLFNLAYIPNLPPFVAALEILAVDREAGEVSLTCRCGSLPIAVASEVPVAALPFGDEATVQQDLARADLLYLPLPFEQAFADLVDFSLSTKLVTYLGSGVPIVYHGPERGAAHDLLARHGAAILATSQDPASISASIQRGLAHSSEIVVRALRLAREEFLLEEQRRRFWTPILAAMR